MGWRQDLVAAAAVVVRPVACRLAQIKAPLDLVRHRFEPGQAVFLGVVPVGSIEAKGQEGVMVLPGLVKRKPVLVEIRPGLNVARVTPENFLDHSPVLRSEDRVVIDEGPGAENVPEGEIDVRPRLGDPFSALFRPLKENRHPVAKKSRPLSLPG